MAHVLLVSVGLAQARPNKVALPAMSPRDQAVYQGGASNVPMRPSYITRRLCQQCWDYWLLGYQTCDSTTQVTLLPLSYL